MSIIEMYEKVFEDCIDCYLDNFEENDVELSLTKEEKKEIVSDLIYEDEPLWDYINNTIRYHIDCAIKKRGKESE